jgi:hypothetical protein
MLLQTVQHAYAFSINTGVTQQQQAPVLSDLLA